MKSLLKLYKTNVKYYYVVEAWLWKNNYEVVEKKVSSKPVLPSFTTVLFLLSLSGCDSPGMLSLVVIAHILEES